MLLRVAAAAAGASVVVLGATACGSNAGVEGSIALPYDAGDGAADAGGDSWTPVVNEGGSPGLVDGGSAEAGPDAEAGHEASTCNGLCVMPEGGSEGGGDAGTD